jgi:prepilin-type N-terminal cleavage/methylation domain-containing protein
VCNNEGVALGWGNGWAFGPFMGAALNSRWHCSAWEDGLALRPVDLPRRLVFCRWHFLPNSETMEGEGRASPGIGPNRGSQVMRRFSTGRGQGAGFTLVELLVVVVIISMLVGLMVPALQGARRRARVAQCTNHQHELSLAIHQYEIAKGRFPGYANTVNGVVVSWVPVLFPFLGRTDLWEGPSGTDGWRRAAYFTSTAFTSLSQADKDKSAWGVHVDQLICPDDAENSAATALSYVVNGGDSTTWTATDEYDSTKVATTTLAQHGVFRTLSMFPGKTLSMSSIKSASQRPMISEMTYPNNGTAADRVWNAINTSSNKYVSGRQYAFNYVQSPPTQPRPVPDTVFVTVPFLPSWSTTLPQNTIHSGIVIITFCDGHTESVSNDAQFTLYDYSAL